MVILNTIRPLFLILVLATLSFTAASAPTETNYLRIQHVERCGDMLNLNKRSFCVLLRGEVQQGLQLKFHGQNIPFTTLDDKANYLQVDLSSPTLSSGPLWLQQGEEKSNAVWVSLRSSHVIAAGKDKVVKNDDGINTYLDLVSIIIEEQRDGLKESTRLAKKYHATIVGMIP